MTKEEAHLWYQFLCRYPQRFRRQYIIGNYIVDFYCASAKLVIEIDGSQHYEQAGKDYDGKRSAYLALGQMLAYELGQCDSGGLSINFNRMFINNENVLFDIWSGIF